MVPVPYGPVPVPYGTVQYDVVSVSDMAPVQKDVKKKQYVK